MPTLGQADLLDAQQGPGDRVEAHPHPRLAGLVLDDEAQVGVLLRQAADAVERVLPEHVVVDLEGVVPPVLPRPELDVGGAELADHGCDRSPADPALGRHSGTFQRYRSFFERLLAT